MKKETIALITVLLLGIITAFTVYKRDKKSSVLMVFNNENNMVCSEYLTQEFAFEGKNSFKVAPHQLYGPTWEISGNELDVEDSEMLTFRYVIKTVDDCKGEGMKFAVTIHNKDGKQLIFEGQNAVDLDCDDDDFETNYFTLPLKLYKNNDHTFKFYFWNLIKKTFDF